MGKKHENTSFLGTNKPHLVLSFLGGVQPGSVQVKGSQIVGRWAETQRECKPTQRALLDFANCSSDPHRVAEFTQLYGPIAGSWTGAGYTGGWQQDWTQKQGGRFVSGIRGREFSFAIKSWLKYQEELRAPWILYRNSNNSIKLVGNDRYQPWAGMLVFKDGNVCINAGSLREYLNLSLNCIDPTKLRICPNPNCPAPFFIANRSTRVPCDNKRCKTWQKNHKNDKPTDSAIHLGINHDFRISSFLTRPGFAVNIGPPRV